VTSVTNDGYLSPPPHPHPIRKPILSFCQRSNINQTMYGTEVFPMNWWLDNTLAKVPNTTCHHCHHHEVVARSIPSEMGMTRCMGCKGCKKTWIGKPGMTSTSDVYNDESVSVVEEEMDEQEQEEEQAPDPNTWMITTDQEMYEEEWRFEHGLGAKVWAWNVGAPVKPRARC
jgi:transcription elongation factor Elf1